MPLTMIAFDSSPANDVTVTTYLDEVTRQCWAVAEFLKDGVHIPVYPVAGGIKPVVTSKGVPVFRDGAGALEFLEAWNAGEREWAEGIPNDVQLQVVDGRIVRKEPPPEGQGDGR